jgi:RNA polymerase sigma-70 factor (ECF subfamily)
MDEDGSLMRQLKQGDHESYEKLVLKHRVKALSFAQRYIHNLYTAEDILQESFADIYVYRERYRDEYSFKTYLFTIIRNKCIDYIRKNRILLGYEYIEGANWITPEDSFIEKEKRSIIRRIIGQLKEDYRTVIYLIEYSGFSYEEAAEIMGRNVGQIKILVFRARRKLKSMIERES